MELKNLTIDDRIEFIKKKMNFEFKENLDFITDIFKLVVESREEYCLNLFNAYFDLNRVLDKEGNFTEYESYMKIGCFDCNGKQRTCKGYSILK